MIATIKRVLFGRFSILCYKTLLSYVASHYTQAVRCTTKCSIFPPNALGKGVRCAPPLHPPAVVHYRHRAFMHQRTFGRSITIWGSLQAAPKTPMVNGRLRSPPGPPSTKELSMPFGNLDQPSADWMP